MKNLYEPQYSLQPLAKNALITRVQQSFQVTQAFTLMQQGLPASYDYADFLYVADTPLNRSEFIKPQFYKFKEQLGQLIVSNFTYLVQKHKKVKGTPQIEQVLLSSFDTQLWNSISKTPVALYKPIWKDASRQDQLHPDFAQRKKQFYKFDIKIFFQIKKNVKGQNDLTLKVQNLLKTFSLEYFKIQGQSRQFCGVKNTVIGGRFNDGVEKPKDPYSLFLSTLIGYELPEHLGGSYLLAQKCVFDWNAIHQSNESLSGVIGRNQILNGSTIFSQKHCPRSHIRLSRIKDEFGNPVSLHRQSKSYTSSTFNPTTERDFTDNINPEEGIIFLGYHKNPLILEQMMLTQLGNNDKTSFEDGLLNFFKNSQGNILYTPNLVELLGCLLKYETLQGDQVKTGVASLSYFHQIRWLKNYKRNEEDEQLVKQTGNPYFLYSRAGYMERMSFAQQYEEQIDPPSARTLRVLSKTFALWQDTWYFDRKQRQIEDLQFFLRSKSDVITRLQQKTKDISYSLSKYQKQTGEWNYTDLPMVIRNGLAIHYLLGHVISTMEYGCRGPVDKTVNGVFGANTFHLQPEDILAGGESNLTFGQGKHVIEYLTEAEKQLSWSRGSNISGNSGIGHVVAYMDEVMLVGLDKIIQKFKLQASKYIQLESLDKAQLFLGSVYALLGFQQYFINYADYAKELASKLRPCQIASLNSLNKIQATMRHLSRFAPRDLHEGAQLALSLFICLHLSGEPVSVGRLDHILRHWAKPIDPLATQIVLSQEDQDIIDSFWIKVGEKPNFNKGFFEDNQKWGNLAMGGNSLPYPQGASFNQWGHQLTVGGSNQDNTPFYNSITLHCLRAARTIPVNAPCLGLRLMPGTPKAIIDEAAKAILAGGAHPILLNEKKIIEGLRQSGNYVIPETRWNELSSIDAPYSHWKTTIDERHIRDFTSDGCHQFLITGRSWFWLGGGCTLQGLEYVLNVGKTLIDSGPRWIHGQRKIYRERSLDTYKTYDQLQREFFATFEDLMRSRFAGQLGGFSAMSKVCPATLLNPFTATMVQRASDFYSNGTEYKLFCPQYTGLANLVNSLWNIKHLVFEQGVTTLQEIRFILLINWGDELVEPFVTTNLPINMRQRIKYRCDLLRTAVWKQPKFGLSKAVTDFGLRISRQLSLITRSIFQNPTDDMLSVFKRLTKEHGTATAPFGFQYLPGCGTFENYEDAGTSMGASFDGRKKGQTLAQDYSPQNFFMDKTIGDSEWLQFNPIYTNTILQNYTHLPLGQTDPQLFSGAVLDLNIDESYKLPALVSDITSIAQEGKGPNLITVTVCSRKIMEEARKNTDRDLLRFRMGGWTQFAVAMFPNLLEQHIRRVRQIHPAIEEAKYVPSVTVTTKTTSKEESKVVYGKDGKK